jgi:hypothetical protein
VRSETPLSVVGGDQVTVPHNHFLSPSERIDSSDAARLRPNPELKILWPVVIFDAIAMVDCFVRKERAPE